MDRHQPAFWLSRPPAEAAEFLARTATASRAVGGFVKRADWRTTLNELGSRPELQHALMGAGAGGLAGLGVGLADRKRRSPWATALSGAALGGLGAGAGSYLYHHGRGLQEAAGLTGPPRNTLDADAAAKYRGASSLRQLGYDLSGIPLETGGIGQEIDSTSAALAKARNERSTAGQLLGAATGDNPYVALPAHGGVAALQARHAAGARAMREAEAYMGATTPVAGKPADPGEAARPGETQTITRPDGTTMTKKTQGTKYRAPAEEVQPNPAFKFQQAFNDIRAAQGSGWRGRLRGLGGPDFAGAAGGNRLRAQGFAEFTPPGPGAPPRRVGVPYSMGELSPTDVNTIRTQGAAAMIPRSLGSRLYRGGLYALPHAAIQLGLNYLNQREAQP